MMNDIIKIAANTVPTHRQYEWQQMEFYAFAHFGINTFTGDEWGKREGVDPNIFNPVDFDANQWVAAIKSAGMTGLLLTAKHHDGFCLWQTEYTDYSVKSSKWKNGKGDVVKEVADACRRGGIKFGIYLSPWDMHEPTYGSEEYNVFYKNQLRELLTNYGELFCLWFDGACGEGKNGKKQEYDWEGYYALIRELQPNAVINICGPDVRWCGNEAGKCRKSEWSVVPSSMVDNEKVAEKSQHEDNGDFGKKLDTTDEDLGSRAVLKNAQSCVWYPCEVDTSIRPGWFYHKNQDRKVKSLRKLIKIYETSVGGNASLLLNIPPDKRGLFTKYDVRRLGQLGDYIRETYKDNLAGSAKIYASGEESEATSAAMALTDDRAQYWKPADGTEKAELTIDLGETCKFSRIVLGEQILVGQRVEKFTVYAEKRGHWKKIYSGTVIGWKKICSFRPVKTSKIKISIDESRICPTLAKLEIYA